MYTLTSLSTRYNSGSRNSEESEIHGRVRGTMCKPSPSALA